LRVIFAGTPEFAQVALERLHAAGFEVVLVLTQPDRPSGRGMKLQASPVKQFAQGHGIPVAQPRSLRLDGRYAEDAAQARAAIEAARADVMVVAAYGLILPQWVLDAMSADAASQGATAGSGDASMRSRKLGCLNIHASLLPRWRGAAPIHRAIEAGDAHTGVTIMQMDAGLDTGAMLQVEELPIQEQDTTASLHDRLADLGARMIVQALELARRGELRPVPQPGVGVSYAHKIEKHEAAIDWTQPVRQIERRIRALNPFPGATAQLGGEVIKIWRAEIASATRPEQAVAGQLVSVGENGIEVVAGDGVLRLTQLQRAGGKRLTAAEFLRGFNLRAGQVFAPVARQEKDR
jgi:methionyl-tRNA formyltransferase